MAHSWKFTTHWWSFMTRDIYVFIDWNLWSFPARSAKPFKNIYVFIDWNLWPFLVRSANSFMNIYGFIDWNLWPFPARSANSFMNIYGFSLMIIFDQKSAKRKTIYDHLWLHWWSFLTKKKRGAQNQYLIDIIFDKEKPIQVKNSWVILNPGQKGFRGSRSQCPTINALGYRLCNSPNNKFRALFCSKVRVSWGDLPSAASPPTYATPIECALWYLQCAPTIASGLPLSIVPSVGIT